MLNRIWKKFTLALLVVAFVPIGYFGYQDLKSAGASILDHTLRTIFLNSVTRAKDIERAFLNANADIDYLRSNLVMQFYLDLYKESIGKSSYWESLMEKEFKLFLSLHSGYSQIGLLDEYGDEVVVVFKNGEEIIALEDSHKRNRLTSSYYVGAATLDEYGVAAIPMRSSVEQGVNPSAITLIRYATKVFDSNGEPRGVIYMDLNGSEVVKMLGTTSFENKRKAALLSRNGYYLFDPYPGPEMVNPPRRHSRNVDEMFSDKARAQILSGKPGIVSDDPNYLFAFMPIFPEVNNKDLYYIIFDYFPREKLIPQLNSIKRKYLVGGILAFLLCITFAVIVSYALTRKLSKLREGVEKIRNNQLAYRLDIRSGDEIESLAQAYNMMASALQDYRDSLEKKVEERSAHIKKVERQLMQAEKLAAIGMLAAGVAHEINNPVSIIVTRLELMTKALKKGNTQHLQKDLDVLYNHASRIAQITGNLLTFSRERSDKIVPLDVNVAAERVISLIEPPMRVKGITLEIFLGNGLPYVMASAAGIEQVIYNIIYNAYQATDPGGKVSIRTMCLADRSVEIEISDTGKGIPQEQIKHIFEPFFTTKEVGQGTGLGLSITYGLIQDFGGRISVESEPGVGTVFRILLVGDTKASPDRESKLAGLVN